VPKAQSTVSGESWNIRGPVGFRGLAFSRQKKGRKKQDKRHSIGYTEP
jgi:hypothetical protein